MATGTGRGERPTPLFIIDLFRAEFSTEEILRLCELRDRYPHTEYLTCAERQRLAFLKWRLAREMAD
jgi:hypothetical protein